MLLPVPLGRRFFAVNVECSTCHWAKFLQQPQLKPKLARNQQTWQFCPRSKGVGMICSNCIWFYLQVWIIFMFPRKPIARMASFNRFLYFQACQLLKILSKRLETGFESFAEAFIPVS